MNSERKGPLDGIPAGEDPPLAPTGLRFNPPVIADAPRIHPENVRQLNPAYAEIAEVAAGPRT